MNKQASTTEFKKAIRHKVSCEQLSSDELAQLMLLQQTYHSDQQLDDKNIPEKNSRWPLMTGLASCLAILLMTAFIMLDSVSKNVTEKIANEVVVNHLKLKPLDVQSDNIQEVRSYFTLLDFRPSKSSVFGEQLSLLGGRYCSIQGVTAVQLRYKADNQLSTLYQVAYSQELFGLVPELDKGQKPLVMDVKGLNVSMWVEKNLLMVLVKET